MRIVVKRHGGHWQESAAAPSPGGAEEVEAPEGATVRDLLGLLGMEEWMACIVAVNGRAATAQTALVEGDRVDLIPPITGGR